MVKEVSDFSKEVLQSKIPVVVDFWAEWCGPCKLLGPVFQKLAENATYANKVSFAKVNIDDSPDLAEKWGVMSIPCVICLHKGEEVGRAVGFAGEAVLKEKIDEWLKQL